MVNPGKRSVGVGKTYINAPIKKILKKLKEAKFIRQNHLSEFLPTGLTTIMNLSHQEILSFYNSKIRGVVNFYSFATNKSRLYSII